MELFTQLFGNLQAFVYHCFDRIVIHGYLSGLSRPEQVVYFFREVLGIPVVSKEVLSQRTNDYQGWVEAYARNHQIPIESTRSSMAIMFSAPTGKIPSSNSMRSSPASCAMNSAPIIYATSA
jgi:hypothetical protein